MVTYSAQCSAVGSFGYANYFKLYVVLTETEVNIANNTSKVQYNVYCQSSGSGSINANHYLYFNINGSDKRNETVKVNVSSPNAYIGIASGTTDAIQHNNDGSKSITFSAQIKASSYGVSASTSGTFTLSTIARASSVSGGSGNIGSTSPISISRASSSFTHTLRYTFGSLSGTIDTGVATSYTWKLPTSFYAQIPNSKTGTGTIYCDTYSGGTLVGTKSTTFTATVTEASSRPIISATLTDSNATTKALTGNANKMVKGQSTGQLVITSSVKNSATIKSVTVNGTNVGTSASITKTYANISTASFTIVTTDSRGFTNTSYILTPSYINYIPLTLNTRIFRPQPTGTEIQMTYSGNYFNGNFGAQQNSMGMEWYYKVKGANDWIKGGTITPTISGNTISEKTISLGTGFNYQTAYEFYIYAQDFLTSFSITIPVSVGMPAFYWRKDFFGVNVATQFRDAVVVDGNLVIKETIQGGNVPIASSPANVSFDDVGTGKQFNKSGLYTASTDNTWFNLINVRHRNGNSDGVDYGLQFFKTFSNNSTLKIRSQNGGTWSDWEDIYRTKSLYDNSSGTNGTVTLSETSANFSYIEIISQRGSNYYSSGKIASPNGKTVNLTTSAFNTYVYLYSKQVVISGTSITVGSARYWNKNGDTNTDDSNKIIKVIGYR